MSDVRPEGEGELLAELVGTWRVTRFDDRDSKDLPWEPLLPPHGDGVVRGNLVVDVEGDSSQHNLEYADRPIEITADRVVIGDQRTWIREAVRLR